MPKKTTQQKPLAKAVPGYTIKAAMLVAGEAELMIYGDIGENWYGDGVVANEIAAQLAGIDAEKIIVRINSYGGSVSDGIAIYNLLRQHSAEIVVRIDAVAVSIASLIAMAGDTVEAPDNILFMLHAPWTYAGGNSKDMRETADMLDKYAQAMAGSYARKTGKTPEEIVALLTDGQDHWFTAAEAKEFGLIDSIITEEEEEEEAPESFARSRFAASALMHAPMAATRVAAGLRPRELHKPAASVAAQTTPKEATMPKEENLATDTNSPEAKASAEKVLAAEKARKEAIRAAFKPFAGRQDVVVLQDQCIDDHNITVEAAREKLLAQLGRDATPLAADVRVQVTETSREKFAKAATASIMSRARLAKDDTANEFRSYSLLDLARSSLEHVNVDARGMDKMQLVAAAFTHSTSDFTSLLANIASKAMMKGYDESEETFQRWTNTGVLTDFKVSGRPNIGMFPALEKVAEGAEYKLGTLTDSGEQIQLATYGRLFSITRQAIINDDLGAFTRIPMLMGRAAIRTVGDLVYAILTSNPNMADGKALFHADHKNLLSAAAINTASVDAMRVAMATQKDAGSNATALNIRLASLLVPVKLEGAANVVRDSEFEVGASTRNNTTPNSVRGGFEVISDARLDAVAGNASFNWFGAANPAMHDTIEVAYLDGMDRPVLEQQNGWSVDGVEMKVRMDAGVKALDFRTLAKNPWTGS